MTLFLSHLLSSGKHSLINCDNITRLIDSYSTDFIHGVSREKVMTSKHFLLGLGLHSITGQKQVAVINNKLGHCISYDKMCEIETALAEAALL